MDDTETNGRHTDADARRVISQHIENCTQAAAAVDRRLQSIDQRLEAAVNQRDASQRELRKYLIGLVSMVLGIAGWVLSHGPIYTSVERFDQMVIKFDERTQRRDAQVTAIIERLQTAEIKIDQLQQANAGKASGR